jgi:sulfite dehydrogenase (quinone) subunit SoeC
MEHSGEISQGDVKLHREHAGQGHGLDAGLPRMLLEVLAFTGYGMWMLLGLALALGIYSNGRGESLVPLSLGAGFVTLGLLIACLRLPAVPDWHGWRMGRGSRPTREAMVALLAYLPMLAVGALARGDNDFWATRLAGAALTLASLAALIYTAHGFGVRRAPDLSQATSHLPISRVVSACYAGGLWLWVCLTAQDDQTTMGSTLYWVLSLLALALLLGGVESMRWRALQGQTLESNMKPRRMQPLTPARFLAAVLVYALPCIALLATGFECAPLWLSVIAAVACGLGKTLEQRLYELALAARTHEIGLV